MGYWRKYMCQSIFQKIYGLGKNPSLDMIEAAINSSYPFTDRVNFPYKVWLDCKKDFLSAYGIKPKK